MKRKNIFNFIFIVFFFLIHNPLLKSEVSIKGFAKVVDGDTIIINSIKIRLEGIDAPEIKQRCKKPF